MTSERKCFICKESWHSLINLGCCDKWFHRPCIDKHSNLEDKDCPACSEPIDESKLVLQVLKHDDEHDGQPKDESGDELSGSGVCEEIGPDSSPGAQGVRPFTLRSKEQFIKDAERVAARHHDDKEHKER